VNKNLIKYFNRDESKEILKEIKSLTVGGNENQKKLSEYINTIDNENFVSYFHKTWDRYKLNSMISFNSSLSTNNHVEREFRSLKLAVQQGLPVCKLIKELYFYSRTKKINEGQDKVG
jgi:hypothetical protein